MARGRNGSRKPGSLQQEQDDRVYNLVMDLLENKTSIMKEKGESIGGLFETALARDLSGREVFEYVKAKDRSFSRVKDVILKYSIERVLNLAIEEEEKEMRSMGIDPDSLNQISDDEQGNEDNMMDNPDTNQANRNIVNLWQSNNQSSEPPTANNTEEKTDEAEQSEKKGKRKASSKTSGKTKKIKKEKNKDRTPPDLTLDSLGGLDGVTKELLEVVGMPILHPEIYLSTGIEPPRGVLLHGPPGCGKTTIANALAGTLQVPFISLSAPSVVSGMSGESEKKLREIFEEAKQLAPCLVFFDEIDAITPKRDGGAQREMEKRIVAQLLTLMDELALNKTDGKPVIVIGATNRPDSLDAALRRAGRFDREICINVPDEGARFHILQSMTTTVKCSGELGLRQIAKMTPGFVGADLKALVAAAGVEAINRIFI
ncbi:unnamed protein product [Ambrosiozyma monospora]|uniref:Unnamed protein product n=1 Tax=Ambrosiozyma monospora TaxID=43982 RepID=A0ACB5T4Y8_AMBMO|nr:unnamed protein product [Ambrosiozyma monospora]